MIRGDHVERAATQSVPQRLAVPRLADRRGTLELRRTIGNVLGREGQVMGTRLGRDRHLGRLRVRDFAHRLRTRHVDDVHARAERARQADRHADGLHFGSRRTGCQVHGVLRIADCGLRVGLRIGIRIPHSAFRNDLRRLRVDEHRHIAPGQNRQRKAEIGLVHSAELRDARRDQKTLEPANPGLDQRVELPGVVRYDAAPESDVDVHAPARRRPLRLERRHRRRRRYAVERHVDDRRHAAGRRGARGRVETFPVRAAGLVDVHVRVHQARRHDQIAEIDQLGVSLG